MKLIINGAERTVAVEGDMPLLWLLRDTLGLTGTKYGCGRALCGACTVHVDGQPMRACVTPVASVEGRTVTTVEGLRGEHPVQQAWQELNVVQCGYCQPGQIMSAVALLDAIEHPSDAEIDAAMAGNLCRCGTYTRVRAAIHRAAERRSTAIE